MYYVEIIVEGIHGGVSMEWKNGFEYEDDAITRADSLCSNLIGAVIKVKVYTVDMLGIIHYVYEREN